MPKKPGRLPLWRERGVHGSCDERKTINDFMYRNYYYTLCIGKYSFLWWSLWGLDSISGVCIATAINSSILLLTNSEKDRPIGHLPYRPTGASSCKNCPFGLINCGQRWPWPWAHDFSCFTFRFSFLFFGLLFCNHACTTWMCVIQTMLCCHILGYWLFS